MRIIVTCGPSYEPIDEVRRITNFSTGQMGSRLARALASAGHEVMCFKGVAATTREHAEPAQIVTFTTNDDLEAQLAHWRGGRKSGRSFMRRRWRISKFSGRATGSGKSPAAPAR